MSGLFGVLEAIGLLVLLLATLVFIHEAGHFIVAKLLRVRVETFSLGFGPRLMGFRRGETDYRVSAIPLGGYVKMTGEMASEAAALGDDPRSFAAKPRWARFLVMVAGAACNVLLAIAVWTGIYLHGVDVPVNPDGPPVVDTVSADGPADRAGIVPGDTIVGVGDQTIRNLSEYMQVVLLNPGATVPFRLERDGAPVSVDLTLDTVGEHHLGDAGLLPRVPFQIFAVEAGSPAERAGVQAGDRVVQVDGEPVVSQTVFVEALRVSSGREVELLLEQGQSLRTVTVLPERAEDGFGRIGVQLGPATEFVVLGPVDAFRQSLSTAGEYAGLLFYALRQLVSGAVGLRVMSGPIEIADISQRAARAGPIAFLQLLALISLQLGIINLLPIPVLDGGNIFILLIEGTARRDLSQALKERLMQAGLIFLVLFMVAVIGFDIVKSLPSAGG
jgi:regulator of sigma E protease